jgi:trigger factor
VNCTFFVNKRAEKLLLKGEWSKIKRYHKKEFSLSMKKAKRITAVLLLAILMMSLMGCAEEKNLLKPFEEKEHEASYYVSLGEYLGVEAELVEAEEVTQEILELNIRKSLYNYAEYEQVERAAEEGDKVVASYQGYMDGELFEGGSASGEEIILGLGEYIPGFEEGIVGMQAGETKQVDVVFPEDYWSADFAGKNAYFEITLEEIYQATLPEYNDEFVAENLSYETVAAYEAGLEASLKAQFAEEAETAQLQAVWEVVRNNCSFNSYPESQIEAYVAEYVDYYTYLAQYSDSDLDAYLQANYGITEAEFQETVYGWAYTEIGDGLIVQAIAEAEGMELGEEEYEQEKQSLMQSLGYASEEDFESAYGSTFEDYYGKDNIIQAVLQNRVYELVLTNAKLV